MSIGPVGPIPSANPRDGTLVPFIGLFSNPHACIQRWIIKIKLQYSTPNLGDMDRVFINYLQTAMNEKFIILVEYGRTTQTIFYLVCAGNRRHQ